MIRGGGDWDGDDGVDEAEHAPHRFDGADIDGHRCGGLVVKVRGG